jgi:hypothetical protein
MTNGMIIGRKSKNTIKSKNLKEVQQVFLARIAENTIAD